MANTPLVGSVGPSLDATKMGPVHPVDASDLYGSGTAPSDQRYTLSPRERDAWQFGVDQAHVEMSQCAAAVDAGTVYMGPFEGPYDAATIQPGVPLYGMA